MSIDFKALPKELQDDLRRQEKDIAEPGYKPPRSIFWNPSSKDYVEIALQSGKSVNAAKMELSFYPQPGWKEMHIATEAQYQWLKETIETGKSTQPLPAFPVSPSIR